MSLSFRVLGSAVLAGVFMFGGTPTAIAAPPQPNDGVTDPGLRECINNTLKHSKDQEITAADFTGLTKLSCDQSDIDIHESINSLAGLEKATNLTSLSLRLTGITDLSPIRNLTKLEKLVMRRNESLTDLSPVSNLTNLKDLVFSESAISNLSPLKNLTNLESLSFYGNQVSDLTPLKGLTKLKGLTLTSNRVHDFSPLQSLPNLPDEQVRATAQILPDIKVAPNQLVQVNTIGRDGNPLPFNQEKSKNITQVGSQYKLTDPNTSGSLILGPVGDVGSIDADALTVGYGAVVDIIPTDQSDSTNNPAADSDITPATQPQVSPVAGSPGLQANQVYAGDTITVIAEGFEPYEMVAFELHSKPIALGNAQADKNGRARFTGRIPSYTSPGRHYIHAKGRNKTAKTPIEVFHRHGNQNGNSTKSPSGNGKNGGKNTGKNGKHHSNQSSLASTGSQVALLSTTASALTVIGMLFCALAQQRPGRK